MDNQLVQAYAPYAAAGLVLLVVILTLAVRRRRGAAEAQAFTQKQYADSVTTYRTQVEQLLTRREELVAGITAIESRRLGEVLQSGDIDTSDPVARLELDVVLAGDDEDRRTAALKTLRRGVSDVEMLLPEPPTPPAPVARLSRRARARAEAWQQERVAELAPLRRLAQVEPVVAPATIQVHTVPAQATGRREPAGDALLA